MHLVKVGSNIVKIEGASITENNLENFKLTSHTEEEDDSLLIIVQMESRSHEVWNLMACEALPNYIRLFHLKSEAEGKGFAKLALAIFWGLAREMGYQRFAMRFGGGRKSEEFLKYLGFPENYISRKQDYMTEGEYSIEVLKQRYQNNIRPAELSIFPTDFFEARTA